MNICARAGCRRPIPIKKTKPSAYCSTRCRVADFRRRERVRMMLREIGLDDLVTQLRCAIAAREQGQKDLLDVSLTVLATHPLLAGSRATSDKNGTVSSSRDPARNRIGITFSVPGAEESER